MRVVSTIFAMSLSILCVSTACSSSSAPAKTGDAGGGEGGDCAQPTGMWKVTDITCNGKTWVGSGSYTAPNSIVYDYSSPTDLGVGTQSDGCTITAQNKITYAGCSFTVSTGGPTLCAPANCAPGDCGMESGSTVVDYAYTLTATTLVATSTNSGICMGGTTVLTATKE
jgi:hypothetical protein